MDNSDIASQESSLPLLRRRLVDRQLPAGSGRAAVLGRRFDAPIEKVWEAVTTPNRIDRYFLPVAIDTDAGTYAFQGQASGKILACDAPTMVRVEWLPPDRDTADQVELRLSADGPDATWFELEHASIADVFHTDLSGEKFSPAIGWEAPLHYLGEYLRGVLPDRPSMEWYVFDEAEELRLAKLRAPEWAKAEADYRG
jgi:uncharacterized protein YndB with AHSA1/START domain